MVLGSSIVACLPMNGPLYQAHADECTKDLPLAWHVRFWRDCYCQPLNALFKKRKLRRRLNMPASI